MRGQRHAPAALYLRKSPGTHCTRDWVGPRTGLDRCGKSRSYRDSIPGQSMPSPVAIPNTLPTQLTNKWGAESNCPHVHARSPLFHVPSAFIAPFYAIRTEVQANPEMGGFVRQMVCGNTRDRACSVIDAPDVNAKSVVLHSMFTAINPSVTCQYLYQTNARQQAVSFRNASNRRLCSA